jgi:hypothetical protein
MTDFEAALLAELRRIADALEALAPAEAADPVLAAIAERFGSSPFTSAEAAASAASEADWASAAGLRLPPLPAALAAAGVSGAHGLGRFLAAREGRGVIRVGQERTGTLWAVAVSKPHETAKPFVPMRRTL